jgi:hypothetical protein
MFRVGLLLALCLSPSSEASCDEPFSDANEILSFHLRVSRINWNKLRTDPYPGQACDAQFPMYAADFRCGDSEPWIPIGVRQKRGAQRGIDAPEKPPLKLDFNHLIRGQRWPSAQHELGYRKLSLNNGQGNQPGGVLPNLLPEAVSWRLLRIEAPLAPKSAFVKVFIHFTDNDAVEYHGLYLMLEDLDRTAMRRRFGQSCGALLKSTTVWCRESVEYDDGTPNLARTRYDNWYDSTAATAGAIDAGWPAFSEASFELHDLIRQEAMRDILGNGNDSAFGHFYNNYYRFEPRDLSQKSQFFPWDLDSLFRAFPQEILPQTPLETTCSPLADKVRCQSSLHTQYLSAACELMRGTLSSETILKTWRNTDALIRPMIPEEQGPIWNGVNPLDAQVKGSYQSVFENVSKWIPVRIQSLQKQIEAEGISCTATCTNGATSSCGIGSCSGQRICADGGWQMCEAVRQTEVCNGKDDDCDGVIDDGCTVKKEVCATGEVVPRRNISQCGCSQGNALSASFVFFAFILYRLKRRRC